MACWFSGMSPGRMGNSVVWEMLGCPGLLVTSLLRVLTSVQTCYLQRSREMYAFSWVRPAPCNLLSSLRCNLRCRATIRTVGRASWKHLNYHLLGHGFCVPPERPAVAWAPEQSLAGWLPMPPTSVATGPAVVVVSSVSCNWRARLCCLSLHPGLFLLIPCG